MLIFVCLLVDLILGFVTAISYEKQVDSNSHRLSSLYYNEPTKDSDLRIVTCERTATCLRIVTCEFGSVSPCVLMYVTNAFSQIKSLVLLIFVTTIRSCNI